MNLVMNLFDHYGYIILFVSLTLELIAFPTPGETLMTYCGFLVFQGKLNWVISIVVASAGVMSGITISYIIGHTLGTPFFRKYGTYVHIGPERLEKTAEWFERYGNGMLMAAYFIPGVRHITGYFSGTTKMPYGRFAWNAYIGAFIWTGTFISLGKILGSDWEKFHSSIKKYLIVGGTILALGLLCYYLYRRHKQQIFDFVAESLENLIGIFHSLGKIKVAIAGVAVAFVGLSIILIGLIQDFLANEFDKFDTIAAFMVNLIFPENWHNIMNGFMVFADPKVLAVLSALIFLWIIYKRKNRFLETIFLFITVLGGEVLEELLRVIFHRLGPSELSAVGRLKYTFPSEQTFMVIVFYGFAAFIILRHANRRWYGTISVLITFIVWIAAGVSVVFFDVQYPSDAVAGYVFGGVWLSLNIIVLEIYRILPLIQRDNS